MADESSITPRDLERMLCDEMEKPKALPLSLLKNITNSFSDEQRIGSGSFAVVYKGKLVSRTVAVKRMSNTYMYDNEFQREVECLMNAHHHENVVHFLGYCSDTQRTTAVDNGKFVMHDVEERLLCFEYLPKGSLRDCITDASSGLCWRDRYQIIMGICTGLHYLHQKDIVHFDLKPENILLADNLVPKITDFGISRCIHQMKSQVLTKISGTPGYLAPEAFNHTEVTYRNSYRLDIYSLGVIMMEILTGNKGYHSVDRIVESWGDVVEESDNDAQLNQVRVCAEMGIACANFDPLKRPDTQDILCRLYETECMYTSIATNVIASHQIDLYMLSDLMHAFWVSYEKLNPDIRRCMEYCSIFPKGSKLRMVELVRLWIAQGFVKTNCATDDIENVAEGYIQELVSCSFLQPSKSNYSVKSNWFTIHDELHDLLDKVARNCFRIENASRHIGWERDVPQDTKHLLIQNYDGELITEKIFGLENLLTLIIYDVKDDKPVEEKVIRRICKRLPKLRVLAVAFSLEGGTWQPNELLVPDSICQLYHLRYFAFKANSPCILLLPRALSKLHHLQVLDFGDARILQFTPDGLINLRHIICSEDGVCSWNIGRLTSLQSIRNFIVSGDQGHEIKQLRNLNKLRGKLNIIGLENVKSKEEALEANLTAKGRLTKVVLCWTGYGDTRCSPEVQAEVLAGLCPPVGLKKLKILNYNVSRYPDWMLGKENGGPKDLQELVLFSNYGKATPQIVEAFPCLRVLKLFGGTWDSLPDNMEQLTSLKELEISGCKNIRSLPKMPISIEKFDLSYCNSKFIKSCQTVGHPNWQKIEHIPRKTIEVPSTMERMLWKIFERLVIRRLF